MKKIIITSILSSLICVTSFGQSTMFRTILSHNGTLTQYDLTHWTDALDNAVDGDTVYFTPGTFPGDITITKKITLIGAGVCETQTWYHNESSLQDALGGSGTPSSNSTNLSGLDINIELDGNPTLTATMLEGLNIHNSVHINKTVTNLKIKRCQIGTLRTNVDEVSDESAKPENLTLENCYINTLRMGNIITPNIYNCYFTYVNLYSQPFSFTNCSIDGTSYSVGCNYINCLLCYESYNGINTYLNCINARDNSGNGSTYTDCWFYDANADYGAVRPWKWSLSYLEEHNYYGNDHDPGATDHKVVGPLGGQAPFTLIPSQPYVSASTVTYDASDKKLNVNITVKKGK